MYTYMYMASLGCSPPDILNSGVVSFPRDGWVAGFGSLHLWCVRLGPGWQVSGRMILKSQLGLGLPAPPPAGSEAEARFVPM